MKSVRQYFVENGERLIADFEKGGIEVADHLGIIIDSIESLIDDPLFGKKAFEVVDLLSNFYNSPKDYLTNLKQIYHNFTH